MDVLWSPLGIALTWILLHAADYLLTVATVRLRLRGDLAERIDLGGSMELNPVFRAAVDRGEWVSRRFLLTLLLGVIAFPLGVLVFEEAGPGVWPPIAGLGEVLAGGLVVTRLHVIGIHLQNLVLMRRLLRVPAAAVVRVRYDRGTVMMLARGRIVETAAFAALAALVTDRAFFWGGLGAILLVGAATVAWQARDTRRGSAPPAAAAPGTG
jgi:hypothetical protein